MGHSKEDCQKLRCKEAKPIVFVLGGPGSGKGTQCDRIVRDFGFLHLSSGDLLREEVKKGTELGRECEQLMKDGKLVPVQITLNLIKKAMEESKTTANGYLVDGFPRAIDQAELFEEKVGRPRLVIFLECPKGEMEKRLLKRGETSGRSDDNMTTILKRFDTFQRESLPVVQFYNHLQQNLVIKVSSVPPPDEVYKQIYCAILSFRGGMDGDTNFAVQ
ncbi:uncharacterized protein [Physcomitrium patens]|uniref:uncharacterized protein isoform X2 n=1 Tax=Physcomitrium patens TaxID=3218 RepID=UPI000D1625EB|nr:adenylate kinase isoenzyme 1-like isoform X2 [Physcomitrium patens]|eukprot:XP_024373085.1 adenylate kinase isoenzyme 1-like isoform X2 [Physcomitrella patens]